MPPLSHLTSCTPTTSNLHLANSLAAAVAATEPALYRLLTFQVPNLMSLFRCLVCTKVWVLARVWLFVSQYDTSLRRGVVSTSPDAPRLKDHPLSAVRTAYLVFSQLYSILLSRNVGTLTPWNSGHLGPVMGLLYLTSTRSGIHYLRTRHAVVTGTRLSRSFRG